MTNPTKRHVHLVGSVNLDSVENVFATASMHLSGCLKRLPDGEAGPRRLWISYQYPMFRGSRFLIPAGKTDAAAALHVTLAPGIDASEVTFPELGYAREAQFSYQQFCKARAEGKIEQHVRFQVALPTPWACIAAFVSPEAHSAVEPAYEAAMLREVAKIVETIPHSDLAFQWDVCLEMLAMDGRLSPIPWSALEPAMRGRFSRLADAIPADVELGYHLCYGDFDGKHMIQPVDARRLVDMANLLTETVSRDISWIHMPVPIDRDDDGYFAPLRDLKLLTKTELYLGLVHLTDGVDGARRRIATAMRFLEDFGIATECGIGRYTQNQVVNLFDIHSAVVAV